MVNEPKVEKVAKYTAIVDSHGYLGRTWKKGDVVEVAAGSELPNKHFVLSSGAAPQAPVVEQPASLSSVGQTPPKTVHQFTGRTIRK